MIGNTAAFALTCLLLIAVPGPSVLFIIGRALQGGIRQAVATAVGNAVGAAGLGLVVTCVLGAAIESAPTIGIVLRLVGATVLVVLGTTSVVQAARGSRTHAPTEPGPERSTRNILAAAALVGATNPKTFIVFAVILPAFVSPGRPWWALLALVPIPIGIGLVTDTAWAIAAARTAQRITTSKHGLRSLSIIGGLLLIGLGVYTACAG